MRLARLLGSILPLPLGVALLLGACQRSTPPEQTKMTVPTQSDVYALEAKTLEGQPAPLASYRGKVTLLVNVASACGYTPQYAGLQKLFERFQPQGFAVLGFPSNDFGRQEPGSPVEIREFCSSKYKVTFPMFEKVQTKAGPGQSPVYALLGQSAGALPEWNFGKYLIGRDGKVVKFYPSNVAPESTELVAAVEKALTSGS
jgi:glutathione peroxidase